MYTDVYIYISVITWFQQNVHWEFMQIETERYENIWMDMIWYDNGMNGAVWPILYRIICHEESRQSAPKPVELAKPMIYKLSEWKKRTNRYDLCLVGQ